MTRLVLARVAAGLVLIGVLTFVTLAIWSTIPVDPISYILEDATPEQTAAIRRNLGFDQPVYSQWGDYVWRLGTNADFGNTLFGQEPVRPILTGALGTTLSLVLGGFAIMLLFALPLGTLCARRAGSRLDRTILTLTVLGLVLHPFVVGLLLRDVFSRRLGLAPAGSYCPIRGQAPLFTTSYEEPSLCGGLLDWAHHMWIPWMTFALFFLPLYVRFIRAGVLDELGKVYVTVARAKGVGERRIVTGHVAQNAAAPIVAMLAVDIAAIVTTAIYVETIFGLPGLGSIVAQSLGGASAYDLNLILGVVVLVAIAVMLLNLFADIALRALDPRVRNSQTPN